MNPKSLVSFFHDMTDGRTSTSTTLPSRAAKRSTGLDEATRCMEAGRWQQAFARLTALADTGQPQAARIALLFVRRGSLLFGGRYHASAEQRDNWQRCSD